MSENSEQEVTTEETKREEGIQTPVVETPAVVRPASEIEQGLGRQAQVPEGTSEQYQAPEENKQVNVGPPAGRAGIGTPKSFLAKALEKIQFRKRAKLEKIVKLALEKGSVNNDRVEKLLHISDSTAQRYLNVLVRDGRLRVVGLGNLRRYEPIGGSNGGN